MLLVALEVRSDKHCGLSSKTPLAWMSMGWDNEAESTTSRVCELCMADARKEVAQKSLLPLLDQH